MDPLEASRLVTDEYSAKILVATFKKPRSAIDLSREYGIPIAACYRRIRQLEQLGLVYCESSLPSRNGKGLQLFRSRLLSVRVSLEEGHLRARVVLQQPGETLADGAHVAEQTLNLVDAARP